MSFSIGSSARQGEPSLEVRSFSSREKMLGLVLAILGIGGLVAGVLGLGGFGVHHGWWHVTAFSHMRQIDSLIMIGAGGISFGITVFLFSRVKKRHQEMVELKGRAVNTHGLGPDAYRALEIEVLDRIPEVPHSLDIQNDHFSLLYIPSRIRWQNQEMDFTLNNLQKIVGTQGLYINWPAQLRQACGDTPLNPGWRQVSRDVLPQSKNQFYGLLKERVEQEDGRLPHALEIATLMLLVERTTGEKLYEIGTFTWCSEQFEGRLPLMIGNFGESLFSIIFSLPQSLPFSGASIVYDT